MLPTRVSSAMWVNITVGESFMMSSLPHQSKQDTVKGKFNLLLSIASFFLGNQQTKFLFKIRIIVHLRFYEQKKFLVASYTIYGEHSRVIIHYFQ